MYTVDLRCITFNLFFSVGSWNTRNEGHADQENAALANLGGYLTFLVTRNNFKYSKR